jgi:hypothetical protein
VNNHAHSGTNKTPSDMYKQGVQQFGVRALPHHLAPLSGNDPVGSDEHQLMEYGMDWNAFDDNNIRNHHNESNNVSDDSGASNPFLSETPNEMNHVEVPITPCPLSAMDLGNFDRYLQQLPCYHSSNFDDLALLWNYALAYATQNATATQ